MNTKLLSPSTFIQLVKDIVPQPATKLIEGRRVDIYSFQAESQILNEVDYKFFYVKDHSRRKSRSCFIIMTKRGETPEQDIDTLLYANGRIFNPGHWMNEVYLTLTQRALDLYSEDALAKYDSVASVLGMPNGKSISVMPGSVVESLKDLDLNQDNISRLQYVGDTLELTL